MDYTYEEVLAACEAVKEKISIKKNRQNMDMRNYLIALRYYKYLETEERIATTFGIDRCSVHSAKYQPYNLLSINDISFAANVSEFAIKFPFDFPKSRNQGARKHSSVIVYLDPDVIKKMDLYMMVKDISRRDVAAKELISKALKLWEG